MTYIILLFGIFIIFAGTVLIVRPDYIMNHLTKYGDSFSLHFFAVLVRIFLGVAFLIGASGSKYPLILQIFGWLSISAALVLSVIGREKFKSLIKQGFHPLGPKISIQYAVTIYCPSNEATWKQHGKHNELMLSQQNKLQPTV